MGRRSGKAVGRALGAALMVATAALSGCQTSVTLTNGRTLQGCIQCADGHVIDVVPGVRPRDCTDQAFRGSVRVPRAAVAEIQHAGKAAASAGTILVSSGVVLLSAGFGLYAGACGGGEFCELFLLFTGIPSAGLMAGGIPLMISGFRAWGGSRAAAEPWGPPCPVAAPLPPAAEPSGSPAAGSAPPGPLGPVAPAPPGALAPPPGAPPAPLAPVPLVPVPSAPPAQRGPVPSAPPEQISPGQAAPGAEDVVP